MKISSLLILLLISSTLFGQNDLIQKSYLQEIKSFESEKFQIPKQLKNKNNNGIKGNLIKLDSIVSHNDYKQEFIYDSDGKTIEEIYYVHDVNFPFNWILKSKTHYSYDSNDNFIESIIFNWNSVQWVKNTKKEFGYDSYMNKTYEANYNWDAACQCWIGCYPKTEYTFDFNNNIIQRLDSYWNSGNWLAKYKNEFTFDSLNRLTEGKTSEFDANQWIVDSKITYVFNSQGELISQEQRNLSTVSGQLDVTSKTLWDFNSNGKLIQKTEYQMGFNSNILEPKNKYLYYYSVNGTDSLKVQLFWYNNTQIWGNQLKTQYIYTSGLLMDATRQQWTVPANQWINLDKLEFTYNSQNKLIDEKKMSWNSANNQWVGYDRNMYSYDSNNKLIEQIKYEGYNNQWINKEKWTNAYDNNGMKNLESYYKWRTDLNIWWELTRNEYLNDNVGNSVQLSHFESMGFTTGVNDFFKVINYFDTSVTNVDIIPKSPYFSYKLDSIRFGNDTLIRYYYSQFLPTNIEKPIYSSFQYYPNPVTNSLTIKSSINISGSTYSIFNILGMKIEEGKINSEFENTINVENLSKGTYILEILSKENQKETIKFVK